MALTESVDEIVQNSNNPLLGMDDSWERVKLGEIADIQNGFAFKSAKFSKQEGVPLIRIRDVGKDDTETFYTGEFEPKYMVQPGDLLVGMDGDFNCARWRGSPGLLNQRVCRITLKTDLLHPKLLDHALPGYLKAINEKTSSVTVKHLSSKTISQIPLPVPPPEQQEEMIAEFEKQFSRLDEAVASLKRVKANLKRYKAAVLKAAVEGKLTEEWRKQNPDVEPASKLLERILAERRTKWEEAELAKMKAKGKEPKNDKWKEKYKEPEQLSKVGALDSPSNWASVSVEQVTHRVTYGLTVRPKYVEDGVPVISAREIGAGKINFGIAKMIARRDFEELRDKCKIYKGDVLFSKTGTIGKVAKVTLDMPLASSQNIAVISPLISSDLLSYSLMSPRLQSLAKSQVKTTAVPDLQLGLIAKFPLMLPPEDEQIIVLAQVEKYMSLTAGVEAEVDKNLLKLGRSRQALLSDAFSGKRNAAANQRFIDESFG